MSVAGKAVGLAAGRAARSVPIPDSVSRTLDATLDRAIALQTPTIVAHLDRLMQRHPGASQGELLALLERRYLTFVSSIGAVAGGTAALPGAGVITTLTSATVEIAAFIEATALYSLSVAHVHGIPTDDPVYRRSLVLGVLLGQTGVDIVEQVTGTRSRWGEVLSRRGSQERLGGLNNQLARHVMARVGAGQGALLIGRALPMGIGVAIGASGNAALGRAAIRSTRAAFGPPAPAPSRRRRRQIR
ncbi:hypothetical protein SAMN05892883_3225 [Jatrophihabitans sp. GAS493]|uniref:hypothetical protein n=1 Tax=Jatrophihabitans sp. GAS493 TaxID=1907575 RepID=UPI000BB8FC57|nr:hypothetical protein [Jatrophihabitans sp. GAS493]SOD74048.1 hypothetical protein SAMN05892883_3225 [Jatrophihabitans sp. GAS493]